MTKQLFTTKEIMNLLGLAQPTISKYVKKGMPVAGKVDFGKGNVYDLKEVTDWIKENAKPTGRPKKEEVVMIEDLSLDNPQFDQRLEEEIEKNKIKNPSWFEGENKSDILDTFKTLKENFQKIFNTKEKKPFNQLSIQPKVFKHRDMPVYVREDLHDKVKREALRHNVTMKKLVEDIVAYHLDVK